MPQISSVSSTLVQTLELNVFLSSADEVKEHREQLAGLIHEVNEALTKSVSRLRIHVQMWETLPGFRAEKHVNEEIIQTLLAPSSLAVVILGSELKPGTEEELEFALSHDMQLYVLALNKKPRSRRVSDMLARLAERGVMYVDQKRQERPVEQLLLRSVIGTVIDQVCFERGMHVEKR